MTHDELIAELRHRAGKAGGDEVLAAAADEIGRLRPDAERYRWLRDADWELILPMLETYGGTGFDDAIDAAMKEGGK